MAWAPFGAKTIPPFGGYRRQQPCQQPLRKKRAYPRHNPCPCNIGAKLRHGTCRCTSRAVTWRNSCACKVCTCSKTATVHSATVWQFATARTMHTQHRCQASVPFLHQATFVPATGTTVAVASAVPSHGTSLAHAKFAPQLGTRNASAKAMPAQFLRAV